MTMRSKRTALLLSFATLSAAMLASSLPFASGQEGDLCPCVVLIDVDGLEPHDVTKHKTPFLWSLIHPDGLVTGTERAGWSWQAPRASMSASSAANAATLLTGGYVEQTGIPADEYLEEGATLRLESRPQDGARQIAVGDMVGDSLLQLIPDGSEGDKEVAAFIGNPALSALIDGDVKESLKWTPSSQKPDPQGFPSPTYCDPPRGEPASGDESDAEQYEPACSAADQLTLNKAITAMNTSDASKLAFTYIHLAELGAIKRRNGDTLDSEDPTGQDTVDPSAAVPQALANLDAALAAFVNRYKDQARSPQTSGRWGDTYLMIVGNHGYEPTPQSNRVPDPNVAGEDLENYVMSQDGTFGFVPQGTMATVYDPSTELDVKRAKLENLRLKLLSEVNGSTQCGGGDSEQPGCIAEVLYMRDELVPPDLTPEEKERLVVSSVHPSWHLDHILVEEESKAPTGISGDLLIVMEPTWSVGHPAPTFDQGGGESSGTLPAEQVENPYTASAGGPRNRAVAAIINGPRDAEGVRQVVPDLYPVRTEKDEGALVENPQAAYTSLHAANANPGDDANATGHERQPEAIDFAPTIAALLQISVPDEQMAFETRFLQEAFMRRLSFPIEEEDLGEVEPDPIPPPDPEPQVIVLPPPPPPPPQRAPKVWNYNGIMRNLQAAVGDKRGRPYPKARSRARLSYMILTADFGKPKSLVKLTFYSQKIKKGKKRSGKRRARARQSRKVVKTLASFDPFAIKRGPAKLTLKVPKVFKPTHVGIVVQQARNATRKEARKLEEEAREKGKDKVLKLTGFGPKVGGIYGIKYGRYLHKRAPKKADRKGKNRSGKKGKNKKRKNKAKNKRRSRG